MYLNNAVIRQRFRLFIARPGQSCLQRPAALHGEKKRSSILFTCVHTMLSPRLSTSTLSLSFFSEFFLTLCQRLLEGECVACGIVQLIGDISTGISQVNTTALQLANRIAQLSCG